MADALSIPTQRPRASPGAGLLLGLVLLVAAGKPILFDTLDPDCFWHLRVAEQLRAEGIHPLVDHLSFASTRSPWTPYSWLAELGMSALWAMGGYRAAVLCQSALQGLFVFLIFRCCLLAISPKASTAVDASSEAFIGDRAFRVHQRALYIPSPATPREAMGPQTEITPAVEQDGRIFCAVLATAAAAILSLAYLSFRPVTAGLTLLALIAYVIFRDDRLGHRTRALWLVIPLTALLINIHLYAVIAPIWSFAVLIGAAISHLRTPADHRPRWSRVVRRYSWLTIGASLACLATPMLPGVIATCLHYQYSDIMVASGKIAEMRAFYAGPGGIVSAVVVAILLATLLRRRALFEPAHWALLLAAGLLLLRLGRFAPAFAIIAAPLFARAMPRLSGRLLERPAMKFVLAMILLVGCVNVVLKFPRADEPMQAWLNRHGPDAPGYPCAAADFVANRVRPVHAKLINEFTWGGYLEWRLANFKTLLDGRTQLFQPDFWRNTYLGGDDRRAAYLATLDADAAILPARRSVFRDVLVRQGWTVKFEDDRAVVLMPGDPKSDSARLLPITPSPNSPIAQTSLGE